MMALLLSWSSPAAAATASSSSNAMLLVKNNTSIFIHLKHLLKAFLKAMFHLCVCSFYYQNTGILKFSYLYVAVSLVQQINMA